MTYARFFLTLLFVALPVWSFAAPATTSRVALTGAATTTVGDVATSSAPALYLFHSLTCPHCRKERAFLDEVIKKKYPELTVYEYEAIDHVPLMSDMAKAYGAERYLGTVPLTFVGNKAFTGYESDETSGREIEDAVRALLGNASGTAATTGDKKPVRTLNVPILGAIDPSAYSLPFLSVLLGFLDGFNVCSLGALVLIIGLSLKLQSRRAIILFGGSYIIATSLVYGALIVAWYHVFDLFNNYLNLMKVGVAFLSLGGGLYFLKEYLRMRKQGAVCQLSESPLVAKLMHRTGRVFEDGVHMFEIVGSILLFATVITVVEFPCSAAVPVVYAGILADSGVSTLVYLFYIALYVVFYMLDELIVFAIAAYKLKLWMASGTFTKAAVLSQAAVLIGIGAFYLAAVLGWV